MASIRRLKKDINYLTDEIVQHSLLINVLFKGNNEDKIKDVIEMALNNRKELMERVRVKKQSKTDYKSIRKDLIEKTDKAFEELAKLTQE